MTGPLTRLGVPKLWGEDVDRMWEGMRVVVAPVVNWLTPSVSYGVERIPLSGGAVLAANHLSAIDHPLVSLLFPRPIHFISKAELLEIPVLGEICAWAGTFPVRRGEADRDALRRAEELAGAGRVVGVHLEGTRQRFGHPGVFKAGGVMIAVRAGVPVIPCGLESFGWSLRNRRACAVVWGDPISLEGLPRDRRGYDEALRIVSGEIVRLWRQAAEAVFAGFPPELPDGARRTGPIPRGWQPDAGRVSS